MGRHGRWHARQARRPPTPILNTLFALVLRGLRAGRSESGWLYPKLVRMRPRCYFQVLGTQGRADRSLYRAFRMEADLPRWHRRLLPHIQECVPRNRRGIGYWYRFVEGGHWQLAASAGTSGQAVCGTQMIPVLTISLFAIFNHALRFVPAPLRRRSGGRTRAVAGSLRPRSASHRATGCSCPAR